MKVRVALCLAVFAAACSQTDSTNAPSVKAFAPETDGVATLSDPLVKENLQQPIESAHPYGPSTVKKWKLKAPSCTSHFRVHFEYIDLEEGYDFVRLTDAAGAKLKSYTGFFTGWSPEFTGAEGTLELISDESTQGPGFKIDAIEYGWTGDDQVVWSNTPLTGTSAVATAHPYGNSETKKWTIQGPVGATKMRVHFKGFKTEARYDIVAVHAADMTQVATYSGALGDFVSAEVPGDSIIIRFVSDPSITDYGFEIDSYDAEQAAPITGACPTAPGCLQVTPNKFDFGSVKLSCSAPQKFDIFNTCNYPVDIADVVLPGSGEFTLASSPPQGYSLAGGALTSFTAQYDPQDLGADTAIVTVNSNEQGTPHSYQVTLAGIGDNAGRGQDDFVQQASFKSDILLVIDDSGSMYEEQQSLAANFGAFIQQAQWTQSDFHIAVTTTSTDMAPAGAFVSGAGHPDVILTPQSPNLAAQFAAKVNVGTNGSGYETCLEASHLALTQPLIGGANAGFLRNDASLAVVCVSDALEQSTQPVKFYTDELINLKGANLVTYNVIGPFDPDSATCVTDAGMPDDGRLLEAVTNTGGVKESICTQSWAASLQAIGQAAAGFRTVFTLTQEAYAPITVTIDGAAVSELDSAGNANWTIDNTAKTITFTQASAPKAGQALHVEYNVACAP